MKVYIVESQVLTAVVGVNEKDPPTRAVARFLTHHGEDEQFVRNNLSCTKDKHEGTWKNGVLEGTYTLRQLIV